MKHNNKILRGAAQHIPIVYLLLLCIATSAPAQTVPQIAEKALAATVYLEMKDSTGKPLGFGSGFFVKPNLIATNYHVIAGAASGTAKLVGNILPIKLKVGLQPTRTTTSRSSRSLRTVLNL